MGERGENRSGRESRENQGDGGGGMDKTRRKVEHGELWGSGRGGKGTNNPLGPLRKSKEIQKSRVEGMKI